MARWIPSDSIGNTEHIGRRLFDEPLLVGAGDQRSFEGILLTHFEEKRGREYSVDRLGKSGIDRRVKGYLLPKAHNAGGAFHSARVFNGWAVVAAKKLLKSQKPPQLQVVASPVTGEPSEENIYHAHVLRPDEMPSEYMAYHLRHLFIHYGTIEEIEQDATSWWLVVSRTFIAARNALIGAIGL